VGTTTNDYGTVLTCSVTNSPASGGVGTQYVCTAAQVTGNAFTQVSPTNVTLTLTNDATLSWQWQTNYWLSTGTNGNGTVTAADGWYAAGASTTLTATATEHWHFCRWEGATNGCGPAGSVITVPMTRARSMTAVFEVDRFTLTVNTPHGTAVPGSVTNVPYGDTVRQTLSTPGVVSTNAGERFRLTGFEVIGAEYRVE